MRRSNTRSGYTVVELMVTVLIVSILAVMVGTYFAKLLTLQEMDREEAYVREKLADICSDYANMVSVGSSFGVNDQLQVRIKYRQETGGVSLETGRVMRVAYLSTTSSSNQKIEINVDSFDSESPTGLCSEFSRAVDADPTLIRLRDGKMLNLTCTLSPLKTTESLTESRDNDDPYLSGYTTTDANLGYLQIKALYSYKDEKWRVREGVVTVERIVRLWNK